MTINEAKIYLAIQVELKHRLGKDYEANALQLALEGLKEVERLRSHRTINFVNRLQGETL